MHSSASARATHARYKGPSETTKTVYRSHGRRRIIRCVPRDNIARARRVRSVARALFTSTLGDGPAGTTCEIPCVDPHADPGTIRRRTLTCLRRKHRTYVYMQTRRVRVRVCVRVCVRVRVCACRLPESFES